MSRAHRGFGWAVLYLLTCVAISAFAVRGPVRALGKSARDFNDFISPYVQTNAWFAGRDPYSPVVLAELWPASPRPHFLLVESADGTLPAMRGLPSPYLVVAFPLLLPIAELPWRIAIWLWVLIGIMAVVTVASTLIRLAEVQWRSPLALMILIPVFLLAPMHTAIAASNIVTVVFALGMIAVLFLRQNRSGMAGVLLIIATALKPTIALPFVIYALVSRDRSRFIAPAMTAGILLLCVTLIPAHAGTLWTKSSLANSQSMFAPGAIDDFSTANPLRFQMVNLQPALFPILQNRAATQLAAALVFVILLGLWLRAVRRDGEVGLLDLAILASAALLPVYHRFTDAGLLLVPVAWALSELKGESRRYAIGCLLLTSPFLVPGAAMLHELSGRYEILWALTHSRLWDLAILVHEPWLILVLCVVLLAARSLPRVAQFSTSVTLSAS